MTTTTEPYNTEETAGVETWWDCLNIHAGRHALLDAGVDVKNWSYEIQLRGYKHLTAALQADVQRAYQHAKNTNTIEAELVSTSSVPTASTSAPPQTRVRVRKCGAKMEVPIRTGSGQAATFVCQREKHTSGKHEESGFIWQDDGSYREYKIEWSDREFATLRQKGRASGRRTREGRASLTSKPAGYGPTPITING